MARSFFTGNYAELYEGTKRFSTQISATPTAFALLPAQATAYAALSSAYVAAYDLAEAPLTRTTPTILDRNNAAVPLRVMASELAKIIDGSPSVTDSQKEGLGLNVRATPTHRPAPGIPYNYKITMNFDGSLDVRFKCDNQGNSGTTYQIWRQFNGVGEYTFFATAGRRKFVDGTIPAGSTQVAYKIQALRSTAAGPWGYVAINFGVSPSGETLATIDEAPAKLAA